MVYLDDSIMQKDKPAASGSRIMEGFISPLESTVSERLNEPVTRISLYEFGLGDPGELPKEPLLCNDVFGFVRIRAAKQGLCYIRPTYGTVSRYGLIPACSSMDQIGVVCSNPAEGFKLLEKIAGHDDKDGAMFFNKTYSYIKPDIKPKIEDSLPLYSELYKPVMEILAYAELCNNLSRYDGIKFGYRPAEFRGLNELYTKTRTEAFGIETKLAIITGCLVLSQEYYTKYYEKAMKIRRVIKNSLDFQKYDILVLPPDSPLPQLTGLPSLTFSNVQLMANVKNEGILLSGWEALKA